MTDNDDKLIKEFLAANRPEVADMGFSRRVMHRLPDRAYRLNRIWSVLCMVAGVLFAVLWSVPDHVVCFLSDVLGDIIGVVMSDGIAKVSPLAICTILFVVTLMLLYNVAISGRKPTPSFGS